MLKQLIKNTNLFCFRCSPSTSSTSQGSKVFGPPVKPVSVLLNHNHTKELTRFDSLVLYLLELLLLEVEVSAAAAAVVVVVVVVVVEFVVG